MTDIDTIAIRRVDGGLLLIFRELLRQQRTTAVAARLGLSQSAVSHALTRLRDVFADPLFVRRPHGLEPTRRALELGPRIDALLKQLSDTIVAPAAFVPSTSTRRFLFSAPEFIAALIGPELTARFRKRAPRASFVIAFLPADKALDGLRQGMGDVALGRFESLPSGFAQETIYRDRYCVVARAGHPRIKRRMTATQYAEIGHVYAYSESETVPAERGETPEIAFTASVPLWLTALQMVAVSDAIATVPRKLAQRQARFLKLQVLPPPFEPKTIEVSAVRRAGTLDPGIDWLLAQIRAIAA
jgi:DNA-binding transcriptional LysR family regulator